MIHIKRPGTPAFLIDPNEKWMQEIGIACNHYTNNTKPFAFQHYKDPLLKTELKKVFIKCAYCDFPYESAYDGDVEHFRPKGRVNEKDPPSPGYYWLANTWENLLLSCQHCNQSRRHLLPGETQARSRGKLDQFPLADEKPRMKGSGDSFEDEEKVRLLINPCLDNPAKHFIYDNETAVIQPITPMGETSIKVYVLWRPELTGLRRKRMLEVIHQLEVTRRELDRSIAGESTEFIKELRFLLSMAAADQPFAGMARYFVKQFLIDNHLTSTSEDL